LAGWQEGHPACKKLSGVIVCMERGADLHMAQQMPLPLIVSCFSKIQIGFTFLVLAHLGSPGKRAVKRVCTYLYEKNFISTAYIKFPCNNNNNNNNNDRLTAFDPGQPG